jgi:hypothetical protein
LNELFRTDRSFAMIGSNHKRCSFDSSHRCLFSLFSHRWDGQAKTDEPRPYPWQSPHASKGLSNSMCSGRSNPAQSPQHASASLDAQFQRGAERELASFYNAVAEMYGPDHASQAALDWIELSKKIGRSTAAAQPDWRRVTIVASSHLASRLAAD